MSDALSTQVLVVGGGPGGYVAAIRAGQLGLKTVLVDADQLGGTCLIRGCIPSKALIHAASKFDALQQHVGEGALGIRLPQAPEFDLGGAVHWKNGIVQKLNGGVAGLLKKARVQVVSGWAQFEDGKSCIVEGDGGTTTHIQAEHTIIATGSLPVELPGLPFGGDVLSSTDALALRALPKRLGLCLFDVVADPIRNRRKDAFSVVVLRLLLILLFVNIVFFFTMVSMFFVMVIVTTTIFFLLR